MKNEQLEVLFLNSEKLLESTCGSIEKDLLSCKDDKSKHLVMSTYLAYTCRLLNVILEMSDETILENTKEFCMHMFDQHKKMKEEN